MSRHRWNDKDKRVYPYKTERDCEYCNVVKVSHHESGEHWIDYWKDGERVSTDHAPKCERIKVPA